MVRATPLTAIRPVSIEIDADTKRRVKRLADARRRSPRWLMREAFRQSAMQAWQDFQARGLHATQREADAWLARLEAGKDAEPPECHS